MMTLGQVKANQGILTVANVNASNPLFIGYINDAVRELMDAGNWWNTLVKAQFRAYQGCITWPRWVGTMIAVNINGRPVETVNRWYSFVPMERSDWGLARNWFCQGPLVNLFGNAKLETDGTTPVFNNIPCGQANYIQVYRRLSVDDGGTITFIGFDENGQPYQEPVTFGLGPSNIGYVRTTGKFSKVEQVIKTITQGPIDVYQSVPVTGQLLDMSHYLPGETNPDYVHSKVHGRVSWWEPCCQSTFTILAKQQFVPVSADTDVVQIDNFQAIETMVMALKERRASSATGYATNRALAIGLLNAQNRDRMPDDQTPIEVNPWGSATPSRAGIGRML